MMDEIMDNKQNETVSSETEQQSVTLETSGTAFEEAGNFGQSEGDMNIDDLTEWLNQEPSMQSSDNGQDSAEQETETENIQTEDDAPETAEQNDPAESQPLPFTDSDGILPADVDAATGEKRKKTLPVKRPVLIAGIIAAILIVVYGIGCIFYSSHFFNRSKINDINVANSSADAVVNQLKSEAGNYVLTLTKRDQTKAELKGKDFDFQYDDNGAVQQALKTQSCWKWPAGLFTDTTYTADLGYKFDDTKLQTAIDALNLNSGENAEPAVNAHPVWQNGEVSIVTEVYGSTVIPEKLNAVVREALKKGEKTLVLTTAGAYETPKYVTTSPEVDAAKTAMEKAAESTLTYTIDDAQEVLDVNTFGSWLTCDENMNVTVDQEQAAAYLASLGKKYDTSGGDFNFTTSGGAQIVVSGGTFGWAVDEAAELPLMTADILSGEQVTRAITSKGAASRSGAKDVGNTYVEVSLSAQTMWLYVDGACIISTPVVTGGPGHRTPTGVYRIESHSTEETLRGTNDDGSQYASFVHYWMPFYHALGDGIHDADGWRSSYGGDIYNYDGSHGCVNTPLSAVRVIYNNTSNGCPVVIY